MLLVLLELWWYLILAYRHRALVRNIKWVGVEQFVFQKRRVPNHQFYITTYTFINLEVFWRLTQINRFPEPMEPFLTRILGKFNQKEPLILFLAMNGRFVSIFFVCPSFQVLCMVALIKNSVWKFKIIEWIIQKKSIFNLSYKNLNNCFNFNICLSI